MKKNTFVLHLSEDTQVDLALMTERDLERIKTDALYLEINGVIKDPTIATLAAFFVYLQDLQTLTDFEQDSSFM